MWTKGEIVMVVKNLDIWQETVEIRKLWDEGLNMEIKGIT